MRELVAHDLFRTMDNIFNLPIRHPQSQKLGDIRVDVKEDADKFTLTADLPGVPRENVKLKFQDGNVIIEVATQNTSETKEGEKVLHTERYSALRTRAFYFGDNINDAEIKASYKDGVLNLDIPKHQPTVNIREISIE